jgi:anti-sigma B factor antagonist
VTKHEALQQLSLIRGVSARLDQVTILGSPTGLKTVCPGEPVSTLIRREVDGVEVAYFQDTRIIDESRIEALGKELVDLASNPASKKVILNFQNVGFMSSAMLGKLLLFGKKCKEAKLELRLCGINENIDKVFKLMKFEKVFSIDKDEESSIQKINKKGWFG